MTTERLYHVDPYLREFDARAVGFRRIGGMPAIATDRTAFYPAGGGQPCDGGELTVARSGLSARVVDVLADDGGIWHVLDGAVFAGLAADSVQCEVHGSIDWPRRFDHMQQHTGQHVLSQAFVRSCGAETTAFHLGAVHSTIDLDKADIGSEALSAAEGAANSIVDAALPVRSGFISSEELARLPLRKPPKVVDGVRVVQVEGFDWSACGGTHVADTAQIGVVKIVAAERRAGGLRVAFLCGQRARAHCGRLHTLVQGLVARLTTGQEDILGAVDRRAAELDRLRRDLADLEQQWAEACAAGLWAAALERGAYRVVAHTLDHPIERAKRLAQVLRQRPGAIVLLGVSGSQPQLIFTRADDVSLDAAALLRSAVAEQGGRGGGRPDWAQGSAPTNEAIALALQAAVEVVEAA